VPVIIAILLVVISAGIAAAGDFMGQRAAKRKVRIGNLRPRHTSRLIAVISGVVISLATYGAMFLLYKDFREALTNYDNVKSQYTAALADRNKAQDELQSTQAEVNSTKAQLAETDKLVTQFRESIIRYTKDADEKRREVQQLTGEVQAKQRQADAATKELGHAKAEMKTVQRDLAAAHKQLEATRKAYLDERGKGVLTAIDLSKFKMGDVVLRKGTEIYRVQVNAGDIPALADKLQEAYAEAKRLVADADLVVDPKSAAKLDEFIQTYEFGDPPADAVVSITVAANVIRWHDKGDTVQLEFSATKVKPLLQAGDLLLTLRISDTGARITVPGGGSHEVPYAEGLTSKAMEDTLVETGNQFVRAMQELGFDPPTGDATVLAAPVLKIAELGSELLTRERPYIIQLATQHDLTSAQWPTDVTINVFKEPGS
jgi:hypothetical protein